MKRFILKSLLAVALVLVALPAICIVRLAIHLQTKQYLFEVKPHQKVLAIGDSHIECSFLEDEQYGIKVFAASGDPYNVSLMRLKELESRDALRGVEILVVGLGYSILKIDRDFSAIQQKTIWQFFPYSLKYHDLIPVSFADLVPYLLHQLSALQMPIVCSDTATRDIMQEGNLSRLANGREKNENLLYWHQFFFGKGEPPQAVLMKKRNIAVHYLKAIKRVCDLNEIKLVLVSAPQHPLLIKSAPPWIDFFMKELVDELTRDGIIYCDYSDVFAKETDDELYRDVSHLSVKGAKKFTKIFAMDFLETMLRNGNGNVRN